jgi:hypothetical protein
MPAQMRGSGEDVAHFRFRQDFATCQNLKFTPARTVWIARSPEAWSGLVPPVPSAMAPNLFASFATTNAAEAEEKWKDQRLTAAASYAVGGGPRARALASTVSAGNRHTVKVHGTIAIMMM